MWTVNILAACGTVVAAYGGAVNPEVTAIPAILAMTFPAWLVLTVILLAADLFLLRRAAIVAGAALVACVGPIMNFAPLNFGAGVTDKGEEGDEAQTFRLVTYNTYEMHDIYEAKTSEGQPDSFYREAMAEGKRNPQLSYLNRVDAQVLCMQETMMWNMNARNFCTPEQYPAAVRVLRRLPDGLHVQWSESLRVGPEGAGVLPAGEPLVVIARLLHGGAELFQLHSSSRPFWSASGPTCSAGVAGRFCSGRASSWLQLSGSSL